MGGALRALSAARGESAAAVGGATAKNRAHRKRRGRRTQNRAGHRLPPWNCAAPHFCLFVRNFANRRRKKFRRYRFTAQTAETRRTERERERRRTEAANRAARERRRNAAAGVRRPQKAAPTEKGADAERKTEPPTAYRHGTAPPRTFASLCVILQTAAAKNFGVTVLRRRPPHRGEPSGEPSVSESAAKGRAAK